MNCRSCGQRITWRRTPAGKGMPLDPDPTPRGNVVLVAPNACRVLTKTELTEAKEAGTSLYLAHFVTCPSAARHRRG